LDLLESSPWIGVDEIVCKGFDKNTMKEIKERVGRRSFNQMDAVNQIAEFYKRNNRYPKFSEENGTFIVRVRTEQTKLSEEVIKHAKKLGIYEVFTFDNDKENEKKFITRINQIAEFHKKNGRYPKALEKNGTFIVRVRTEQTKLSEEVIKHAKKLGIYEVFTFDNDKENEKKRIKRINQIAEFHKKNGRYPKKDEENGTFINNIRAGQIKLSGEDIKHAKKLGIYEVFTFDRYLEAEKKHIKRINQIAEFYKKNGRYPKKDEENGTFISSVRAGKTKLSGEVIKHAKNLGIYKHLTKDWNK
jgi:siroheme synthase (precorrin-2 oxidase/ferrochelatase)